MSGNFDQILGVISDGVLFVGPTGAPRFVNRRARDLLGASVATLAREARVQKQIERVRSGEALPPLKCEIELVRDQQREQLDVVILDWKSGGGFVLIVRPAHRESTSGPDLTAVFELIRQELAQPIEAFIAQATATMERLPAAAALRERGGDLISRLSKLTTLVQVFGADALVADERIGLRELITEIWPTLQPLAGKRLIAVSLRGLDGTEPPIYGHRKWVRRAIEECLDNAIRHARAGTDTEHMSNVEIVGALTGQFLAVTIRNFGLGILPKRSDRVFLPFSRIGQDEPKAASGMGIGLALARRICELHGGRLDLTTPDDDAVECTLQFPTGARTPATAEMDIAQAQKYAQDLAKLLARRRTPSTSHAT